jgi:DNA-binding protein H-NS
MAEPDASRPDLLARAEQAQAHSRTLREQVADAAEAVAQVEEDVARVHEGIAEQGGSLADQAGEHAKRAREVAAKERAEESACTWTGRLRMVGLSEPTRTEVEAQQL